MSSNERNRSKAKTLTQTQKKPQSLHTNKLHNLPTIPHPNTLLHKARKTSRTIKPSPKLSHNALARSRKHSSQTIDALTSSLTVPLRDVVKGYRRELKRLHPFERTVAELTVIARQKKDGVSLDTLLEEIGEGRKELLLASKDWIFKGKEAPTSKEAGQILIHGQERLLELFEQLLYHPLLTLMQLQNAMGKTPVVKLDAPAMVLVGAPNVGKSSIVRAISTGVPEIGDYPFTTRGMTMGHVKLFYGENDTVDVETNTSDGGESDTTNFAFSQLCQVMDSPGLLHRPDEQRNEMEALTLAAMEHLPTAVMYVMDLSGGAGDKCSSVEDQLILRREVRKRFPRRPWIDVVSKCDLGLQEGARETLSEIIGDGTPYLEVSVKDGTGVQELRIEVTRMLNEVRMVLDAMAAIQERSAETSDN